MDYDSEKMKKRQDNSAEYPRNKIKRAKVRGEEHVNHRKKVIPRKVTGEPCTCKNKCFDMVAEQERKHILQGFLSMESKNHQDIFLQGLITCRDAARRKSENIRVNKDKTFSYSVMVGNKRQKVCHAAFLSIYAVTKDRVKRLRDLLRKGEIPVDRRGKQPSTKALNVDLITKAIQHISQFPTKESHYSSRTILYLPAQLSVKKMYRMFKEQNPDTTLKYEYYNRIFRENFDLRFGRPAVDTCCYCEELDLKINSPTLNDVAKRAAMAEKSVHKARAKKFYAKLDEAKTRCQHEEDFLGLCFDYMQNVSLPIVPVQQLFYLRQLTVSVFSIHNIKTGKNTIYLYHEGQAHKGPDEVCTFILKYIQEYVGTSIKKLMLFCDNCGGQNKNHCFVRLNMALVDSGRFQEIDHMYPMRGHSFLPCDRAFGVLKRSLRRCERLYTPRQLVELIVQSSTVPDFFTVHMVTSEDILNFKQWWTRYYKKTALSLETKDKRVPRSQKVDFTISKFHHFNFIKVDGNVPVKCREFINGLTKHTFLLKINNRGVVPLPDQHVYMDKIPIKTKKMADLKKCVEYVPEAAKQNFWDELLAWPTVDGGNVEESD